METPTLELSLIPASDEPPLRSRAYQRELKQFEQALNSRGLEVSSLIEVQESAGGGAAPLVGEFVIKLANTLVPIVATVVVAWLYARKDRKVRLKIGDIEAEAQTREEVEQLLDRAQEIQKRNQHRVIREP